MTALILKPTKEEWDAKRPYQVGASEIGTILGISKYGSRVDLWEKKVNEVVNPIENEAMLWGHLFEDGVAKLFQAKTGLEVISSSTGDWQFVREGAEWMSCSPDRTYWLPGEGKRNARDWKQKGLLECKTTVVDPEKEGNEWMLQCWYAQVQWQLLVSEMTEAHLCCAVLGFERKSVIRHWPANPEFQAKMLAIVEDFWFNNVKAKVAPKAVSKDDIDNLFPIHTEGKTIEASQAVNDAYLQLKNLTDNIKAMTEEAETLKEQLILAMEDAEKLEYNGMVLATYKAPKASKSFDTTRFKAENPALYAQYCEDKQGGRRFLLK